MTCWFECNLQLEDVDNALTPLLRECFAHV